jgi:hypothetical protein
MKKTIKIILNTLGVIKSYYLIKTNLKKFIFDFFQNYFKNHLTPVHFYSPIPDYRDIPLGFYERQNPCIGIDFNLNNQLITLNKFHENYFEEYLPKYNSGLATLDAFILYSFIRDKRPKIMIEIGSGESTKISLDALERNFKDGINYKFIAIEPFPKKFLKEIKNENFSLIISKVQDIQPDFISKADILFIDSSHVSKIYSDVNHEMLNILPLMKVGSIIHWHDIMIPVDYPENWIRNQKMFWNESYMVQTFMMFNASFRIIWAAKYLQLNKADILMSKFPYFAPEDPDQQLSSFWIERIC